MKTLENYYDTTLEKEISFLLKNNKVTAMYRRLLNSYITNRKLIIKK